MEKIKNLNYIIITPAKDEEKFIEFTLRSVCNQTMLPLEWIIVDDNSSDRTYAIVEKYTKLYPWIKVVRKVSSEKREIGPKVVNAFNFGLKQVGSKDYYFIVKLDADLTLPPKYFETISDNFNHNPLLGICGGVCAIP